MIFKTDFKVKTTFVAIFIAIACMACLSCANDIEYVYEESISLMAMPDKTEYVVGDTLDLTGLAVTSIGKDGKPVLLPDSAFTVEPPHGTPLDEAGTQTVTVSHGKRSLTFPIKVAQESVFKTYLAFSEQPQDKEIALYAENETLSAKIILVDDGEVSFVWYRKNPGEADFSEIARTEPGRIASLQVKENVLVLPKNNFVSAEYYCVATLTASGNMVQSARSNTARVTQRVETGLPVVRIDTENGADVVSKEEYVSARFALASNEYGDLTLDKIKIKGRGNSSWGRPKKPYTLKFDSKTNVLGMEKGKKWVLVANYSDKTLFRNDFASYLGTEIFTNMAWNPSFKSVDFILNGEYKGTYLLGEQIKIDKKRVNIQDISDAVLGKGDDLNGDGTVDEKDGGFIFEVNTTRMDEAYNYRTKRGIGMSLKDPDVDDFVGKETVVEKFMESVIQTAEDALYSEHYTDTENGYAKYLDVDSFIDWYLVNELAKNNDACWFSSVYLYYNPADGKLHMGPDWDFDIGFGNIDYNDCDNPEGFWIKNSGWHKQLFTDSSFAAKVKARWNEVKGKVQRAVTAEIQSKADAIAASAELNFKRWQILGTYVWPNAAGYSERNTYQSEVDYLINWTNKRYVWLDTAINGL